MRPSENDLKYMWDMVHAGQDALSIIEGWTYERLVADLARRLALERALEIIGEAARHVSTDGRARAPHLGWGAIVATRHILAHEYGEIDHTKLWRAATVYVPTMVLALTSILKDHPPGPESLENLEKT